MFQSTFRTIILCIYTMIYHVNYLHVELLEYVILEHDNLKGNIKQTPKLGTVSIQQIT